MYGGYPAFFRVTTAPIVSGGADVPGCDYVQAHSIMLAQVCRDYAGVGDFRALTATEIRFFYDKLRAELKRGTRG